MSNEAVNTQFKGTRRSAVTIFPVRLRYDTRSIGYVRTALDGPLGLEPLHY